MQTSAIDVITQAEQARYAECKENMRKGFDQGIKAIEEIRDERLYRVEYNTFEEFCQKELHHTRQHINRLIRASELEPIGSNVHESHARVLLALSDPLEQQIAVQLAIGAASKAIPSGKVTAAMLEEAVKVVQEIKETNGKVELDEKITAAEAKVILNHHERVQEHIDNATIKRAAKGGGTGLFIQGKARITGTANRQVFFEFEDDELITQLRKLWISNQGTGLEIRITKKGKSS